MNNGITNNPSLKVFWKNLKKKLEPLKLGDATRRGIKEELKKIPIPGFSFLLEFVNSCYEAGREAAQKVPQDAADFYAQLSRNLEKTKFSEIVVGLKSIGIESEPNRFLFAAMLKSMGKLEAFQSPEPIAIDAILKGVITHRQESLWRHNQILAVLYELSRSAEISHCRTEMAIDGLEKTVLESGKQIDAEINKIRLSLDNLPGLWENIIAKYREKEKFKKQEEIETDYLNKIDQLYGYLWILGIEGGKKDSLRIDPAFVTLSFRKTDAPSESHSVKEVLNAEDTLVIVGNAGSGKSTILQWEAFQCATGNIMQDGALNRHYGMIPFFLRCREFREKEPFPDINRWVSLSAPGMIGYEQSDIEIWVKSVLETGRAILIIDGLDEMSEMSRHAFWPKLQVILRQYPVVFRISSRPAISDLSMKENAEWREIKNPKRVEVLPLTADKIDDLIDKWHDALVESKSDPEDKIRVFREIQGYSNRLKGRLRRHDFRDILGLVDTPLLCSALCVTNRRMAEVITSKKKEFYRDICKALLFLRDVQSDIRVDLRYDNLDFDETFGLHSYVAYQMMSNPDFAKHEKKYLIEAGKGEVCEWLREVSSQYIHDRDILDNFDPVKLLDYFILRRCLMREPVEGRIDFNHRYLQEFLAASYMLSSDKMGEPKYLKGLVYRADDDLWRDTIRLAGGGKGRSDNDCVKLIRKLMERGDSFDSRTSRMLAVANMANLSEKQKELTGDILEMLRKSNILPPQNKDESQDIAAAGDAAIPLLKPYLTKAKTESGKLSALALFFIGSQEAFRELDAAFSDNLDELLEFLSDVPNINSLEFPSVIKSIRYSGFLPRQARNYVYDLNALAQVPEIKSLDLSFCRNLIDPVFPEVLRNVKKLNLQNCAGIRKLEGLSSLAELRELNLRGCANLTSLVPLDSLSHLVHLDLSYCPNNLDIASLKGKDSLRVLEWLDRPDAEIPEPSKPPVDPKPGDFYYEKSDGFRIKMAWISEGEFQMGGKKYNWEKPIHTVNLRGFWMATYQVTQSQYQTIMRNNPSEFKDLNCPVECVSWNDAKEFCKRLSERTGRKFTLPTEAQWEYACRAGSDSEYCFGDSESELGDYAWYGENSDGKTHPVGQKKPNNWGLYDMHGNVWEWCLDHWHENHENAPNDGNARISEEKDTPRLVRGGSWDYDAWYCRSSIRFGFTPGDRGSGLGFRVCLQSGG